MVFIRIILLSLFLFHSASNAALFGQERWQQPYKFEHLSQEQGLSYNTVTNFTQDTQGFLWIATFNGLNRYDGVAFKTFSRNAAAVDKGLPREIRLVYADRDGNVWVGGFNNTIGRFNPRTEEYVPFLLPKQNTVKRDFINTIKEDAAGTLWLTTIGGLYYFDKGKNQLLPFKTRNGEPFIQFSLGGFAEFAAYGGKLENPSEKRLWIRKHGGLIECDIERQNVVHHNFVDSAFDKQFFYGSVVRDSSGYLWCSDIAGLYCFDTRTKSVLLYIPRETFAQASFMKNPLQNDFMTRSILCAPDGSLWFASSGGIVVVRYKGSPQHYSMELLQNDEANPFSLSGNTVRTLFTDRTGVIWAGGEPYGINKFTPYRQKFLLFRHLPFNQNSLSNNYVRGLCLTRSNTLWVGTQFGGISRYEPQKRLWTRFREVIGKKKSERKIINETWAMFEDRFGTVWAGTRGNGLLRFDETLGGFVQSPLVSENALIQVIREDRAGNLLLGTRGNTAFVGVFVIPPDRKKENVVFIPTKRPQSKNFLTGDVLAIHEDRFGTLWIGGTDEIMCLNIQTKEIEDKTSKLIRDVQVMPSNIGSVVTCLTEDKQGTLWISSKGLGLVKFDRDKNEFSAINEEQGLPNNAVYAMLEDATGNFWISSDAGLTRWNRKENIFRTFTTADGLQGREYNRLSYCKGADGMMFFGGINGFNAFDPEKLLVNPAPPPVVLTSLKIFAEEQAPGRLIHATSKGYAELRLRYDQNFLTFTFAAMDFHVPENNQYAYRLDGVDREWIYNGTRHEAVYTGLDPGEYVLHIRAANNDGIWNNEGLTLHVVILPPWWQTWWFRAILILSGVVTVALVIQNYRQRIRRLQEHRRELLLHIDERQRAETELQRSEEKFRALFETSTLGMVLWQNDGAILEINDAFMRLLGFEQRTVEKLNFWQILGEANSSSITYSLKQRRTFGPIEQTLVQEGGEKIAVVMYGIVIGNQGEYRDFEQIWSVIEDITERKRATDALLRYQLNPHFMFNVLNSVNALMAENQRNAKRMIIQFSSLLRHTLVASTRQTAPLGDEIDAVEHYLAIEKIRFEERLEAVVQADRETLRLNVPVFLVQPLVENAVKYGMQSSNTVLFISVSTRIEHEELCIEVANTGKWLESGDVSNGKASVIQSSKQQSSAQQSSTTLQVKKRSTGIGLANLRKRLEQYYAESHTMTITEEQGMVKVRITIALKELSDVVLPASPD